MPIQVQFKGLPEAARRNEQFIRSLQPLGALDSAANFGADEALRYAQSVTHVWWDQGGALRGAHRVRRQGHGSYTLFIEPSVVNPRGQSPAEYGPAEHARGGEHAFYERTEAERGSRIAENMGSQLNNWWSSI